LWIKYLIEYIISLFLFLVFFPIMVVIYFLILVTEKRNPIFKQKRVGKSGEFEIYKFNTMVKNAQEVLEEILKDEELKKEWLKYKKLKNDPRITKIGRFLREYSLDELPQIINVLKGEMSLIGPRPYLKEELDLVKFKDEILSVKPGITGLWQVSGRNELPFEKRLILDRWYAKKRNLKMDLCILLKTIFVVLSKKGSY